jgi:methyl-accepting chemotaxis protein PixJ
MSQTQQSSQPDPNQSDEAKNGSPTQADNNRLKWRGKPVLSQRAIAGDEEDTVSVQAQLISATQKSAGRGSESQAFPLRGSGFEEAQNADSRQPKENRWSLKAKAVAWSLAVSVLPILIIGTVFYASTQSISRQIREVREVEIDLEETNLAVQQQRFLLLMGTGATALLAGAIAVWGANRLVRPVRNAADASARMASQLRRGGRDSYLDGDELKSLEIYLKIVEEQFPKLIAQQEAEAERSQIITNLSRRIWEALSEEDVLKTTVVEVRQALRGDRAVIIRFDSKGNGVIAAEAVAPGWTKTLQTEIRSFSLNSLEQYQQDRLYVIDNIEHVINNSQGNNPSDYQIAVLERLGAKASLSAPLVKENQLFGLLIVQQCSGPRFWQQPEIDLLAQIATQVGAALDRAKLLQQVDAEANQAQTFINITRRIRESPYEEDILKTTVQEVRRALKTDRVIIYSFDERWYGTVVAESVLPGWPKALQAKIKDPCFAEGYVEKYQNGRINAISNIYEAGLTECYLRQLEPFDVKANLVVPILKDERLFGLLIAHQCSWTRNWQQSEIDFLAQIATQVGFALDHARILQKVDSEQGRTQLFSNITRQIRESLKEEDILQTTVEQVRKSLSTDRVIIYSFDENWYGTVIAESVVPGFPKALWAQINDPCFAEGYVEKYQQGRVQATSNIHEAGLTQCYLNQLEPFAVKANLVAPILKDERLFGLLIAHECSKPREWQQSEINLLAQLAMQVGFALDHARLLTQVEQAYYSAEATSREQRQQKEGLQRQVIELLKNSEAAVEELTSQAISQLELVTTAYNHIREADEATYEAIASVQQAEAQNQQISQAIQAGQATIHRTVEDVASISETAHEVAQKVEHLDEPAQKLVQLIGLVSNLVSQLKLQATNATLEVARIGTGGQELANIAQKVSDLTRQLDTDLAQIKPLATEIKTESYELAAALKVEVKQAIAGTRSVEESEQKLIQIAATSSQMNALLETMTQTTFGKSRSSDSASQAVLEVANAAQQISEQSANLAAAFAKLVAASQEL